MPGLMVRLGSLIEEAGEAGLDREAMIVDPGFGMGKGWRENFQIMRHLEQLRGLGLPVLVGPSRKGMIGRVLGVDVHDRLEGSIALTTVCIAQGADVVRVHDVLELGRAARMADAIVRG